MRLSLSQLMSQWTVDYEDDKDLVIVLPATREVGVFLKRAYFRLMNVPEEQEVTVILIETDYTEFRKNDLGYSEEGFKYVSRAYALAEGLANDKINVSVVDGEMIKDFSGTEHPVARHINMNYQDANVLVYGLPNSLYPIKYLEMVQDILNFKSNQEGKLLGVYVEGTEDKGLRAQLIGERGDIEGIEGLGYDDTLQTQLGVSTLMFTILNKWISGISLSSRTMGLDLANGNIKLGVNG